MDQLIHSPGATAAAVLSFPVDPENIIVFSIFLTQ